MNLSLIYLKTKNKNYFKPVEILLNNLCSKGIYDHLEGGISRYAVDEKWRIPHFEKMLYDNIIFINLLGQFYLQEPTEYYKEKLIQTDMGYDTVQDVLGLFQNSFEDKLSHNIRSYLIKSLSFE